MADAIPVTALAGNLIRTGQFDQARALLQRHLQKHPQDGRASSQLSTILARSGLTEQALYHARRAVTLLPGEVGALINVASILAVSGNNQEAITVYRQVLERDPKLWQARATLATLLAVEYKSAEAAELAREVLGQSPDDVRMAKLLATSRLALGYANEAMSLYTSVRERSAESPELSALCASTSNYVENMAPDRVAELHRAVGSAVGRTAGPSMVLTAGGDADRRPLRVGFVSADLRRHSVAFFLEPLLRGMDRERFVPVCFSNSPTEDDITSRLRALSAEWHPIHRVPDADAARLVRDRRIDILIDLMGLVGMTRLGMFAMRPAPVQATYLGYPNTTGLAAIDYRIVDEVTDPPGFETRCTEKLARLKRFFMCYAPLDQAPPGEPSRIRTPGGGTVFASFNALCKLSEGVVNLWSKIVNAVPGSRLVLKNAALKEAKARDVVAARFAGAGMDPSRLELLAWVEANPMSLYDRVDVALDTFPYNGATTTCEALWMGVPVVTLEGSTHAGRVGTSTLSYLGHPEWIAKSHDEYVRIAVDLAADNARLDSLRRGLRPLVRERLGDQDGFARDFCALLDSLWMGRKG